MSSTSDKAGEPVCSAGTAILGRIDMGEGRADPDAGEVRSTDGSVAVEIGGNVSKLRADVKSPDFPTSRTEICPVVVLPLCPTRNCGTLVRLRALRPARAALELAGFGAGGVRGENRPCSANLPKLRISLYRSLLDNGHRTLNITNNSKF